MKAFILALGLLTSFGKMHAQTNFGIAYYMVPEGWQVVQQSPDIILEQRSKNGKICRIIISATEKVAIDNEDSYRDYRQKRSKGELNYENPDNVTRKEDLYSISFFSNTSGTFKNNKLKSSFYSFTNKQETFFVQFISDYGNCEDAFSYFLKSLQIEEATTVEAGPSTKKSKAKPGGKPRGRPRKVVV